MTDEPQRIPEQHVKQILSRAIDLDELYRRDSTVADIRLVAAEIGISREAIDRAIEEAETSALTGESQRVPSWRLPVAATVYGVMLGATASTLFASRLLGNGGDWLVAGSFAVLQISGVALAAAIDPDHRHFQRCNFGLWFGAAAGVTIGASVASVAHTVPLDYALNTLLSWIARGWILSAAIGSGALLVRSAGNRSHENHGTHRPFSAGLVRLKHRVATTLRRIADYLSGPTLRLVDLFRNKQPAA